MPDNPTLLLADDDGLILATLGAQLRDAGYRVTECRDGDEVLRACEESPPDLAVLDIGMPGLSGIEAAHELRQKRIPVVFLTARTDQESVDAAVGEGGLGYVVKPVDITRLIPVVKASLQRGRDMRVLEDESARMAENLETGRLINVAVGIVMERFHLGREESFNLLRNRARSERRKLSVVAQELTGSVEALNRLGSPVSAAR